MKIVKSTQQINVSVAINIIRRDNHGQKFLAVPLLNLTVLIMAIWSARVMIARLHFGLSELAVNFQRRWETPVVLAGIAGRSILWGIL
ncbi:MAG: hypothetical protein GY796_36495 [Chloroflexi bacterium]|nr:hypothetical protein [Chloroflexota bacterium]